MDSSSGLWILIVANSYVIKIFSINILINLFETEIIYKYNNLSI